MDMRDSRAGDMSVRLLGGAAWRETALAGAVFWTADVQSWLVSGGDGRGDRGSATGVGQERGGEGGVGWDGVTGFGFVGSRGESA